MTRLAPLLLILCLLPACTSPQRVHDVATASAIAVNDSVVEAHDRGMIDDSDFKALYPHLRAANGALVMARAELPEGGETFDEWIDSAREMLDYVKSYLALVVPKEPE